MSEDVAARLPRTVVATWRSRIRRTLRSRAGRALGVLLVALAGSSIGAALAPAVTTQVGPLQVDVLVRPSLDPGVHVLLAPAGVVTFHTHWMPVAVEKHGVRMQPQDFFEIDS